MSDIQLELFDDSVAKKHKKIREQAEMDAFLLKHLGARGSKRWKEKDAKLTAVFEEARQRPLRPDLAAKFEEVKQRYLVQKPIPPFLTDEYVLLDISLNATERDVKNAYRRKARKAHPDRGGSEDQFKALKAAYDKVLAAIRNR
jgi:DnaJ family protein C protein 3